MEAGGNSTEQEQAIRELAVLFGDDNDALLSGVRQFVQQNSLHQSKSVSRNFSESPTLLEVAGVSKTYKIGKQKLEVLKSISLSVKQGEFIAITGASGSGKSTLLQLLGGLDTPTSGDILFGGKNLAKMSDARLSDFRRDTIGFVFQFFYLQPFLRLEKNLEVPAMFARSKKQARRERVLELAQTVGLADRLQHYPRELSGGQMQRAAIARALLNSPKILLADEPTGNLDSVNGKSIIELFERIRDEFGMTIVIVTHDAEIARRADREIILKDGVML